MNRPCRVDGIKQYDLEDEKMLYSGDRSVVFTLNDTMSKIWALCDGARTPDDIAGALAEQYGCEPGDLIEDVARGIEQMGQAGVLCETDSHSSDQE